jgi:hypothetical protein
MTPERALAALRAEADPDRASGMAAYHKADLTYLSLTNGHASRSAQTFHALKMQPDHSIGVGHLLALH